MNDVQRMILSLSQICFDPQHGKIRIHDRSSREKIIGINSFIFRNPMALTGAACFLMDRIPLSHSTNGINQHFR